MSRQRKPLNEALEAAKESRCENFIIDLSTNGGGSDQTMGFLLDMIYDGGIAPDVEMIKTAEDGNITATLYDPEKLTAAVENYYKTK